MTTTKQYDARNRLTNQVWKAGGATLAGFGYTLGATGNRTASVETVNGTARTCNWAYDYLYRLTGETLGNMGTVNYGFDAVGNRTNRTGVSGISGQTASYTANDWLASDAYDANGNTTNSGPANYQYDALNHLTNANHGAVLLTYDGDGNRVGKTVGGVTTCYLVDDRNPSGYAQVLEEYQGTNLSRVYNYGLALISERQAGSGAVSYYGTDGHGSTRFLTDPNGTVTDSYVYDAYGILISGSGSTPNNYLYCGQQWDGDLGMYYLRARYYQPDTGRFWTMDTFEGNNEDPLSLHKYLYCQADPVNHIDLSGLDTYLICYSEDDTSIFKDAAAAEKTRIEKLNNFKAGSDKVVVVPTYTVTALISAFRANQDICYFAYMGHGGRSVLYLGFPIGRDYNLSPFGGQADGASDSTEIAQLPKQNVKIGAMAYLFSCYSATSDDSNQNGVSIARAFADYFGITVLGSGAGVSYKNNQPVIKNWRIVEGWRERLFKGVHGGGGWQIIQPDFISSIFL